MLERISGNSDELPQLLGITQADNPNLTHPFVLSQVAEKLGYTSWQKLNKYLEKINNETGVDLRATDNKYHCKIKTGKKDSSKTGKWSVAAIDLLKKVIDGRDYNVDIRYQTSLHNNTRVYAIL
ncbi:hypothetical protein [Methylobacterium tarhaniae]|uniref:hypothetical protein n=1 Tax=Methylobacterium tarhaniae TaxID=1187852 RepID=UPI0012EE49A1|nr:hypothetical protein [Methylobacterium tarhaniae]